MILKPRPFRKPNLKHPLATGLVGAWFMNEGGGNTIQDLSGNGSDGVLMGGDIIWYSDKFGSCLKFPGSSGDYVNCGTNLGNILGSANKNVSVSFWFKIETSWVNDGYFSIGPLGSASGELDIVQINDTISLRLNSALFNKSYAFTDTTSLHHAVATYDGVSGKLYLDGVKVIDSAYSAALDFTGLTTYIGIYYATSQTHKGLLDNVSVFNRAVSDSEIALLYREPFCMFEREPIELWTAATSVGAPPVGNVGIMTTNTGFWGATY